MDKERISVYKPEPKILEPAPGSSNKEFEFETNNQTGVKEKPRYQVQIQEPRQAKPSIEENDSSRLQLANRVYLFADGYERGVVLYVDGLGDDEFVVMGMEAAARSEQQGTDFGVWQREMVRDGEGIGTMTKIVDPTVIVGAIAQFVNPDEDQKRASDGAVRIDLKFSPYKVWDKLSSYIVETSQIQPNIAKLLLLPFEDYSDTVQELFYMSKQKLDLKDVISSNFDNKEQIYQTYNDGINNVSSNMPYPSNFDSGIPTDFSDDVNHFESNNGGFSI